MLSSNDPATPAATAGVLFHVGTVDALYTEVTPSTLNLSSNGKWVKAVVVLPPEYSRDDVVPETVFLNGVIPVSNVKDWPDDPNGLLFEFDRDAVRALLGAGDAILVTITGEIENTIYFMGTDEIRVIDPVVIGPNGGEYVAPGQAVDIMWLVPEGWEADYAELYYSADGGASWGQIATDVTGTVYNWTVPEPLTDEAFVRVYLFDQRGVMGFDDSDEAFHVVASILDAEGIKPSVHALMQNAPNPFRGATTIAFDLPQDERVELAVYDVNGRQVRVLRREQLPQGRHQVAWDGLDSGGRYVASGIYFYRLTAGEFRATKRMFLMR
jgi:hypothetical protein